MTGFPKTINYQPAAGVEGDFCDSNPRSSVDAGPGGLIVGSAGAVIGRFHWTLASPVDANGAPTTITNSGTGLPTGFLHREQQGLITAYLAENGMTVLPGAAITLMKTGGFWGRNNGSAATAKDQKVFANNTDGSLATAAAGATVTGFTETKWVCHSVAAVGENFKFSATPNG
jgi:hypothetical protein